MKIIWINLRKQFLPKNQKMIGTHTSVGMDWTLFNMNKLIVLMVPVHQLTGHKLMSLHNLYLGDLAKGKFCQIMFQKLATKFGAVTFCWTFSPILNNSLFCAIFLMVHAQQIRQVMSSRQIPSILYGEQEFWPRGARWIRHGEVTDQPPYGNINF